MDTRELAGFVVIRTDDVRAHIYPDVKAFLAGKGIGVGGDRGAPVEFFDRGGRRLVPSYDSDWRIQDLQETAEEPQPERVLERLRAVFQHMDEFLRQNPEVVVRAGLSLEDGLDRLPLLDGLSLPQAFEASVALLGHLGPDIRDPWHNFWVHGIF